MSQKIINPYDDYYRDKYLEVKDQITIREQNAPAAASSNGFRGEIRYDSNYIYVCVAGNTWKRVALSAW